MFGGNVGAVARVAANFEIGDLRVVVPACDVRGKEARLYATAGAVHRLEAIKVHSNLESALAGVQTAVGFTRRTGALRQPSLPLSELVRLSLTVTPEKPLALVFGREDGGLTNDELQLCTHICSFDVGQSMPSLNLSHAVAVVAARLFEAKTRGTAQSLAQEQPGKTRQTEDPASVDEFLALVEHWKTTMREAGLNSAGNPERMMASMQRALTRARLTKQELGVFRAYLSKTQVALGTRKRGKPIPGSSS